MISFMINKKSARFKMGIAVKTMKWFVTCMNLFVLYQTWLVAETLAQVDYSYLLWGGRGGRGGAGVD